MASMLINIKDLSAAAKYILRYRYPLKWILTRLKFIIAQYPALRSRLCFNFLRRIEPHLHSANHDEGV